MDFDKNFRKCLQWNCKQVIRFWVDSDLCLNWFELPWGGLRSPSALLVKDKKQERVCYGLPSELNFYFVLICSI